MTGAIAEAFVDVRADTSSFTRDITRGLDSIVLATDKTERRLRVLGRGLTRVGIGTGLVAITQQAFALTAALTPISGILAAIPAVATSASAGIGTLLVGLSGVGDAFKATSKAAGGVAIDTTSMQRAIEAAQRGIVSAQRDIGTALRDVEDAHHGVASATENLVESQKDALDAQLALTAAREEATRVLASYQDQIQGAALSQERAQLGLLEAQQRLIELTQKGADENLFEVFLTGSEEAQKKLAALAEEQADDTLELRRAKLDIAEAEFRLQEATKSSLELQERAAKAQQAGIEGDANVIQARERVAEATDRVADASYSLAQAQRAVGDANQGVADAQERLVLANQDLADSIDALNKAQTGSSAAADKAAEAMAKLSPAARATVQAILGLRAEWDRLRTTVQERLFTGLDDEVRSLATASLPTLTIGLSLVAGAFNALAKEAATAVASPFFQERAAVVFRATAEALDLIRSATGPLILGIANLAAVGQPFLLSFTKWVSNGLKAYGEFLASERGTRKMTAVLQRASKALDNLWGTAVNLGRALKNIFSTVGADGYLSTLEQITKRFADFTASEEGREEFRSFFENLGRIAVNVGAVLPAVIGLLADLLEAFNSLPEPVQNAVIQFAAWSILLGPLVSALAGLSVAFKGVLSVLDVFIKAPLGLIEKFSSMRAASVALADTAKINEDAFKKLGGQFDDVVKKMDGVERARLQTTLLGDKDATKALNDEMAALQKHLDDISLKKDALKLTIDGDVKSSGLDDAGKKASGSFLKGFAGGIAGGIATAIAGALATVSLGTVGVIALAAVGAALAGFLIFHFREQIGRFFTETLPEFLKENVPKAFDPMIDFVSGLPERIAFGLGFTIGTLFEKGKDLFQGFKNGIDVIWDTVLFPYLVGIPFSIGEAIGDVARTLFDKGVALLRGLKDGAEWVWDHIVFPFITGRPQVALDGFGDLRNKLIQKGRDFLEGLHNGIVGIWETKIKPFFRDLPGNIVDGVGDLKEKLLQKGKDIVQGLIDGITAGIDAVRKKGGLIAKAFFEGLDAATDSNSPSREMFKRGEFLMTGLMNGIESQRKALVSLATDVSGDAMSAFNGSASLPTTSAIGRAGMANTTNNTGGPAVIKHYNLTLASNYETQATPEENFRRMELLGLPL